MNSPSLQGLYSDGRDLRALPVGLEFTEDGRLLVTGGDEPRDYPLADVRVSSRLGSVPRFLYLPDGAVVEAPDDDRIEAACNSRRGRPAAGLIHFLETHSGIAAAATVLVILLVAGAYRYGLPALARHVAHRTPAGIEAQAGQAALATISQHLGPSGLNWTDRLRVQRQLQRLHPGIPADRLPRLEYRSMGDAHPNVFALPGNIILVSDEFVHLALHDDEIAAVLAHELGHLEMRHGMQSVLRGSFALLFVTATTGDLSTLTSFAGTLPFMILQNGYSRDMEREADAHAHALMTELAIPLYRFTSIMRRLDDSRPEQGSDFSYLSTHPSTEERLKLFAIGGDEAADP